MSRELRRGNRTCRFRYEDRPMSARVGLSRQPHGTDLGGGHTSLRSGASVAVTLALSAIGAVVGACARGAVVGKRAHRRRPAGAKRKIGARPTPLQPTFGGVLGFAAGLVLGPTGFRFLGYAAPWPILFALGGFA